MTRYLTFCAVLVCSVTWAGDWPQILGPNRNGIAAEDEHLADRWPQAGPEVLWEKSVGSGYSGIVVQGDIAVLFHRDRGQEIVEALDVQTGDPLWSAAYPTTFYPQVGGGDGPLCTPTISDGLVVTYGAQGVLSCLDLKTGQQRWQVKTHEQFRAQEGYFGAGSSPIVIAGQVIVNVGGSRTSAGVVAFSIEDGSVTWKKTDEPASYSAPTSVDVNGLPHVLLVTRYKCMLLDAASGAMRFQFPFGQRGPTVNGATPLVIGDTLFVTSSYGIGSVYGRFDLFQFEKLWDNFRSIASQYCTPIHLDGHLYVIDGRDDIPPADLKCVELATGRVLWTQPDTIYGTLIYADGKFVLVKTNGELELAELTPSGAKILSRARSLRGTVRALPALSNGRLYIRNENTLKCLNVAAD